MTNILPVVSQVTRFDIAQEWLRSNAPFVLDRFWSIVKASEALDVALLNATHDIDAENNWETLREELLNVAGYLLSENALADMLDQNQHVVLHMEVSQASMLEPHEEAAVWAYWERTDQQSAEQERYDLYMNEY